LQKKDENEDSDKEKEKDDEDEAALGSKIIKVRISSIRLDTISKTGFGISRKYV